MLSSFYQRYSLPLLVAVLLSFPVLMWQAETIRSNNDIETWLPKETPVRTTYEQFKRNFGLEEVIVVGTTSDHHDARLFEALAKRIEAIPGIRNCWTPDRFLAVMKDFGVEEAEAKYRLEGLVLSESGKTVGLFALLDDDKLQQRSTIVKAVRKQIEYCQMDGPEVFLSGAPVIVSELDRLGSKKANRRFFLVTLVLSLGLLYYSSRHWGLSLSLLGLTLWGINLTLTLLKLWGGEMNFILGSLPIMVMIFTLSISIHLLSYYTSALEEGQPDPLGSAMLQSWRPCMLSTSTTLIGLISLNVSSIVPVQQFGLAAACGSVVALVAGLGLTPAILVIWPNCLVQVKQHGRAFHRWGEIVLQHHRKILAGAVICMLVLSVGLIRLESHIDPVEFLPKNNEVSQDLKRVENELTMIDSIEVVVDFEGKEDLPFLQKMEQVRELERRLRQHQCVKHTMSLATFFPAEIEGGALEVMGILKKAQARSGEQDFLSQGDRLWRISARVNMRLKDGPPTAQMLKEFEQLMAGAKVTLTGVAPMLDSAQNEIFTGFWQSFTSAFCIISLVMIISLRSFKTGMIAMVPNLIPIWLVFGVVGFLGLNVDIGMMMTGSIALGISVDCTFHFLVRFKERRLAGDSTEMATLAALEHTGQPVIDSAIVGSVGMLALTLSNFAPTAQFGLLMAAQMIASLLGELVLLPALLCFRWRAADSDAQSADDDQRANVLEVPQMRAPHYLDSQSPIGQVA
ncbi:MAG: exporter of the superfamily protein-like protein [Planctomycetaceae bacterium]|nr:exporter of the superfamily protein-like protein [Planctomycetaceae bacterium]